MDYKQLALDYHKKHQGKITVTPSTHVTTTDELSTVYSPGVGAVSQAIADDPALANTLTWKKRTVAVVSDGSAVLGLGDIGPLASLPVMEGKSMLFKSIAGIDSVPVVLDVHSADEIVATVAAIAPTYGGINLEDIAAPKCFAIEEQLKEILDIPVFHDDQHGTAIVTLAGLINAAKVVNKSIRDMKIVLVGAGAAGVAIAKLLHLYAQPTILAVDSKGIIHQNRTDLNEEKQRLLDFCNPDNLEGTLEDALALGADVFIGVSKAGLLSPAMVKTMARDPIIFAMANPVPEIMPDQALQAGAKVIATGRSDFPNQINNVLGFPGIFKGALANNVTYITDDHKIAAAEAIANLVASPSPDKIIPGPFEPEIVNAVAGAIR